VGLSTSSQLRFRILRPHARGGLGEVFLAYDQELNREVALKEIQGRYADDRDSRGRFLLEATITGGLEHPGIVPVYGLGRYIDGRPYYAMRFIRGDSLKEAIEQFHKADRPGRDPGERNLELHKLLGRFLVICNTLAYAHSKGVVHRDLKPGNIMLGPYGETLVVDWGLAKPLGSTTAVGAGERPLVPVLGSRVEATQMGAAVGTPQFMSPEQAAGRLDELGPASDVYSLGATLYALLTGKPPLIDSDVTAVLERAARGDFPPPRAVNPRVPRALEAVCLKAMALRPADRYASARLLAEDIEHWLADEPVSAWREPWTVRTRRWLVRHRTLVTATAAAVLVAAIGLTTVLVLERRRLDSLRSEARDLIADNQAHVTAHEWNTAKVRLESALAKIGSERALADLSDRARDLLAQTDQGLKEQEERQQAEARHQQFLRTRDDALFYYGTPFTGMDPQANLEKTRQEAGEALALFAADVNGQGALVLTESYSPEARVAIPEGYYELHLVLAEAEARKVTADPHTQAALALRVLDRAAQLRSPGQAYHLRRARYLLQAGDAQGAKQEHDRAEALKPVDATDYFLLGDEWYRQGKLAEAARAFDGCLRLEPTRFWAQFFLAVHYLESQHRTEARASLTACLSQRPKFLWNYLLRGMAEGGLDEFASAEDDFRKALQLDPDAAARHVLYLYRGGMRLRQGQLDTGIADLKEAASLKPDPQAHEALAQAYQKQKQFVEAARELDTALALAPKQASLFRSRARLHLAQDDRLAALADYQKAADLDPAGSRERGEDLLARGQILQQNKDYDAAVRAFDAALQARPDLVDAYRWRAEALLELKRYKEAAESCDRYLAKGRLATEVYLLRGRARNDMGNYAGAVDDFTWVLAVERGPSLYTRRGWAYLFCEAYRLAQDDFAEAVRLNPQSGTAYNGRGLARVKLGAYREAVADGEEALRLGPQDTDRLYNVACIHAQAVSKVEADASEPKRQALAGQYRDRAVELIRKALELLPKTQRRSFWRDTVVPDSFLDPIRQSPGFRELETKIL
jgi:tetratricopeptide (TPR) repeat protein/tRNA A-37 threonylcarbamoyl transferase component Bud32